MLVKTKEDVSARVHEMMSSGFHCSEALVVAVSEYFDGHVDQTTQKISNSFLGGIGYTSRGNCGAITGGAIIIGAMFGRSSLTEDETLCRKITGQYYDWFETHYGCTICQDVKEVRNRLGLSGCADIVAKSAVKLTELIENYR